MEKEYESYIALSEVFQKKRKKKFIRKVTEREKEARKMEVESGILMDISKIGRSKPTTITWNLYQWLER